MEYRTLGRTGVSVSGISLGGWLTYGSTVDAGSTAAIVRRALERGVNHFDTADAYASGRGEEVFGEALHDVRRSSYVLASKVFWPTGPMPTDKGLSRKHIFETIHTSLRRLRTDYLDLFYCHRYDPATPLEETVRAMEDLVAQGKTLYWGVSCWTSAQIRDACRLAGRHKPSVNQPPYNVFDRNIERDVLGTCAREGLGVVVWSPLAGGVLTGKYLEGRPAGSRAAHEKNARFMEKYFTPEATETVRGLVTLAKETGYAPAELALGWCLRRREVTAVLVGATSEAQLEETVQARTPPEEVLARVEAIAQRAPLLSIV
ncbi:MAG: aldo/keto reductase family protein [Planctomycetes bacterium]|nr:aldo/keto reductase family protein [Planctomycetota bacterium]